MPQPLQEWTVLPHGRLEQLDENLLTVTGSIHMPLTDFPRRMTVVRLRDARLVIYSAIALDESEMEALEAYGRPAFLVVPGDHHRLDARIWKDRYPDIQVIAPEGAWEKVAEVVPVDATEPDFGDPDVQFVSVPGTDGHEAALVVKSAHGTSLVVNDLIGNIRRRGGFGAWLLEVMGYAGKEPQIPMFARFKLIENVAALRDQLLRWSGLDSLQRILVSHGDPIDSAPASTLRALAAVL